MSIWSRLFGKRNKSQQSNSVTHRSESSKKSQYSDSPQDIDLNSVHYIPLPPSPKKWEVDGRDEFHKEFENPEFEEIFRAGWQRKHTKVIKLSSNLTSDQLTGQVGEIVAKAYRDTILKRSKANQIKPAAKWAAEMLDTVPAHCTDTDKRRYNKIIKKLDKAKIKHQYNLVDAPPANRQTPFTLSEGSAWTLSEIKSIPKLERPDTAFTPTAFTADGILYTDNRGKSELASHGSQAALRKINRSGCVIAEKALSHNIYRIGCNPTGSFLAIMDKEGLLYIYDASLNLVTEKNLQNDKRVKQHFRTTETNYWGDFKSQIRAVDVSADGEFVLFTLADEAWCCSISGNSSWGVRMPLNEGWERAVGRSERTALSGQVEEALEIFQLALPVTPKDIQKQYRLLAKRHHPDRNINDQNAHKHMQEINEAFQILTGIDPEQIDFEVEESEITFFRRTSPDHVIDAGEFQIQITIQGGSPQDWVYGASFLSHGGGAFLATYSGKVIEIDSSGKPTLIYDVGSIPDEMIDAGKYLYILTQTRLYVIEGRENLVAFIDVFNQGKLLVTTTGFGLLDNKSFQWFSPSGTKIGEITSCHPIRAVYDSAHGAVVETRQHRTIVKGLQLA